MSQTRHLLATYAPTDAAEQHFKARMLALLAEEPRAFWRDVFTPGHFTRAASKRRPEILSAAQPRVVPRCQNLGDPDLIRG